MNKVRHENNINSERMPGVRRLGCVGGSEVLRNSVLRPAQRTRIPEPSRVGVRNMTDVTRQFLPRKRKKADAFDTDVSGEADRNRGA